MSKPDADNHAAAIPEPHMKIQAGKPYTDRKGRKVIIVREMKTSEPHRFLGVTIEASGLETHDTWDEEGRCDSEFRHCPWDIVAPWSEKQA